MSQRLEVLRVCLHIVTSHISVNLASATKLPIIRKGLLDMQISKTTSQIDHASHICKVYSLRIHVHQYMYGVACIMQTI